jgi:hypothetical protein
MEITEIERNFAKFFPKDLLEAVDSKAIVDQRLKPQNISSNGNQ